MCKFLTIFVSDPPNTLIPSPVDGSLLRSIFSSPRGGRGDLEVDRGGVESGVRAFERVKGLIGELPTARIF